jgi:NAD(P)-dependent dehydrogenase (short-subunit alcohol dehydrogenase family)
VTALTPLSRLRRILAATWRQNARSLRCPPTPRLDGRRALVTGGNAGIGLATCRGLLERGAQVLIASRNAAKAERAVEELRAGGRVSAVALDLADLRSVREAATALAQRYAPLDLVICNAGLWPQRYEKSPQGHELAFATNVLGHFALLTDLIRAGALAREARVVVLTGDIYVLASECTPDYAFTSSFGGMLAYCRSKLGDIWIARELQRRHPELHVAIAHPGVVASNLGGKPSPGFDRLRRGMMISTERGAETSLFCATQPVPRGAYIHNTLGELRFGPNDPAGDRIEAERLWECCEALCRIEPARS